MYQGHKNIWIHKMSVIDGFENPPLKQKKKIHKEYEKNNMGLLYSV